MGEQQRREQPGSRLAGPACDSGVQDSFCQPLVTSRACSCEGGSLDEASGGGLPGCPRGGNWYCQIYSL